MSVSNLKWLRLYDWGGINNQDASTVIGDGQAQLARNHIIRRHGALEKRYKKGAYGGATSGNKATAIEGMIRAYSDEDGYGMKSGGTDDYASTQLTKSLLWLQADPADSSHYHLYYGDDSDGTGTSLKDFNSVGSSSTRLRAVQWGNRGVYIAVQSQSFYYWALNTDADCPGGFWDARLSTPSKTGAAFALSGDAASTNWAVVDKWISCAVTYEIGPGGNYGTWGETPGCARFASKQVTDVARLVEITSWDQPAANYRTVNVYQTDPQTTEADADAAPLYLCKSFYYDEGLATGHLKLQWDGEHGDNLDYSQPMPSIADTGWVTKDGGTTGNYQCIAIHNDRLWVVVAGQKDRLWYSNLSKPHEFAATNFVDVGSTIQQLDTLGGSLMICTEPGLYSLSGWSPDELGMSIKKVSSKGTTSGGSVVTAQIDGQEMLFRLWHKQIWAFDGTQDHWIGYPVQGTLDDMTWAQANNCRAVAWRDYVFFGFPDAETTLVFDCVRKHWYLWEDWTPNCWAAWDGVADNGQLYWGDSTTGGMIYRVSESGYELCNFRYKTKAIAPEGPDTKVLWRWFRVEADQASFPLTVSLDIDFGGTAYEIIIPSPPTSGWDFGSWGGFEWQKRGTDRYEVSGPLGSGLVGTYIAAEPNRNDDGSKKIYGITLGYTIKGREASQ